MFLVLLVIALGVGYEIVSDKEPVQLHQQERQYDRDTNGNRSK